MKKNQKNEQNKDIYVNQNLLNIISPSAYHLTTIMRISEKE